MSLFRADTLNSYRSDPRIATSLKGTLLLNLDEFLDWFHPVGLSMRKTVISSVVKNAVEQINESKREVANNVLRQLPQLMCLDPETNAPAIGEGYGIDSIDSSLTRMCDVIFAVNPVSHDFSSNKEKLKMIVGFIITKMGECHTKPYVHGIKLICTTREIKSRLLLGAYLYCIKNSQFEQEGLLDLAGGYRNMSGFIAYSRMGFNKDPSLADCSYVIKALPMSIDVNTLSNQIIIQRATGKDIRVHSLDDSGLYNIGSVKTLNDREKWNLQTCNNLIYKIQMLTYPIFIESIKHKPLLWDENVMLTSIPSNEVVEQYLINYRSRLLLKAYPPCKKGRCDQVMGWFGYKSNFGFGIGRKNKTHRKKALRKGTRNKKK
jgi:hypothetical protein